MEKAEVSLQKDREGRTQAREAIKKNGDDLIKRKKDLKELEKQLKEEEKKLEEINLELKGKTDDYMSKIEEHQRKLAPWTEKINEKKKHIDVKISERELLAEKLSSESIRNKHAESKTLPKEIKLIQKEIGELESKTKERNCRNQLSVARQKADDAKMSLQQSQSRGKVLDSLLRMRDSGRIKGIYNRLGSLGVIDDKYDVAVSTACPALDNIVVETVEAGQACIEYLRKNNLGRGVFTVLEKLEKQWHDKINTPEDVPRLFDLIKPKDKKFLPAFYSVMQDTLVAENMQQANRIAYGHKRWRVVTLDGKLIEKSGAMTGGGNRQLRGAMDSRFKDDGVTAEMVVKLERERDKIEDELQGVLDEKRACEMSLRAKKESLPRKQVALEKLEMDMSSMNQQLSDEKSRIATLKAQVKPSPEDVKRHSEIEGEIECLQQEMQELKDKTADIEEQIKSLQEDIMEAGGMDLRLQKIVVDDVKKRIDSLNNKITKAMVAKAKAEKDVTKLEANIKKTEKEKEKIETDLKEVEEESKEKAKEAAQVMREADESKKVYRIVEMRSSTHHFCVARK
ncbi:SMCs flexible hinge [Dichotomocladium elegans]|nr:SMCs flexible hinge [Dichotomocladium elegans]